MTRAFIIGAIVLTIGAGIAWLHGRDKVRRAAFELGYEAAADAGAP